MTYDDIPISKDLIKVIKEYRTKCWLNVFWDENTSEDYIESKLAIEEREFDTTNKEMVMGNFWYAFNGLYGSCVRKMLYKIIDDLECEYSFTYDIYRIGSSFDINKCKHPIVKELLRFLMCYRGAITADEAIKMSIQQEGT